MRTSLTIILIVASVAGSLSAAAPQAGTTFHGGALTDEANWSDGTVTIRLAAHLPSTADDSDAQESLAPSDADQSRPNVLVLAVDDMNDMLGSLGKQAKTPNIDRLAARGVNFSNAHVAGTYCTPSRTALLTGLHPANSGWYGNQLYFVERPELVSLPAAFKQAGYKVHGGGKIFHHMPGYVELDAFDEFFVWHDLMKQEGWRVGNWIGPAPLPPGGKGGHSDISQYLGWSNFDFWQMPNDLESEMADTINAETTAEFVSKDHDAPFFMAFGTYAPHKPNYAPKKYFDMYPLDEVKIPEGYKEGDLDDVPPRVRANRLRRAKKIHQKIVDNGDHKRAIRGYLACVSYADAQIGRVLDALHEGPNADNTIVVFWSDHGYHLGEKQKWAKHTLWERTTNAPFIWAGPGVPEGIQYDGVVSFLDVYPTLMSMTGIEPPHDLDGRSLEEIFEVPQILHERYVSTAAKNGQDWAVVSNRWRYIYRGSTGEELYNSKRDPHEWNNLAGNSRYDSLIGELKSKYPDDPVAPGPDNTDYRLIQEGESFRWEPK